MSGRIEDRMKEFAKLPELEPDAALEPATLASMAAAAGVGTHRPFRRAAVWAAATVAGALLAAWSLTLDSPDESETVARPADAAYVDYVEEAARLEQFLVSLPEPRRVMRAGTASTIVGLENRIALIDAELSRAAIERDPPEYRTALMRDRVEAMNALVYVRYAQSKAFIF